MDTIGKITLLGLDQGDIQEEQSGQSRRHQRCYSMLPQPRNQLFHAFWSGFLFYAKAFFLDLFQSDGIIITLNCFPVSKVRLLVITMGAHS